MSEARIQRDLREQREGNPGLTEEDGPDGSVVRQQTSVVRNPHGERRLLEMVSRAGVPIVLVALFALFSVLLPDVYPTWPNVANMLAANSVLMVLALALTLPLRGGDFDLSIAATMSVTAAIVGVLTVNRGVPVLLAVGISIVSGLLIGALNGGLVVFAGVNAFIATLGMLTALGGLAYALTGSAIIQGVPESLQDFWRGPILGLPTSVWFGWALAAVLLYIYEYTPAGRHLLVTGGAREAARLSGLPVQKIRFITFVAAGGLSGVAGVMLAGNLGSIDPSIGPSYLLPPYAAVFLGTTTVLVGRFNVVGTVLGLYLTSVGITGLLLFGVPSWAAEIFLGSVLVLAVLVSTLSQRFVVGAAAPK